MEEIERLLLSLKDEKWYYPPYHIQAFANTPYLGEGYSFAYTFFLKLCKLYAVDHEKVGFNSAFFIDQAAHLGILLLVANYHEPFLRFYDTSANWNQVFLLILALVLLTNVASKLIGLLISIWSDQTEDNDKDSLKNAGHYIGQLERLFIFGFVLSGNIQAVGFLLAAKSIFRFGDLKDSKDRKLTEYILIGTLLSFGFALLIAFAYLWFQGMINM